MPFDPPEKNISRHSAPWHPEAVLGLQVLWSHAPLLLPPRLEGATPRRLCPSQPVCPPMCRALRQTFGLRSAASREIRGWQVEWPVG
eukprot:6487030-Amphidinium_carterae.1